MSTFVLVHGAWHGAWCWYKVAALLREQGHKVITPDLPALGVDRTPLAKASLQAYADKVCAALDASDGPAVLVGHSMGGVAITQAAEARPHKISKLVYLTAFLLPSGRSLIEEAQTDAGSAVLPNLAFAPDNSFATVKPEAVPGLFYADCSSADVGLAQTLLVPQAAAPFMTPVQTTAERWGSVARVYIECTEDKAISLPAQRAMVARLPCEKVLTLTTSHSPFFSAPEALTRHLLSV